MEKNRNYNAKFKKGTKMLMEVAFTVFHGPVTVAVSCLAPETKAAKYGMSKPKSLPQPSIWEQMSRTNRLAVCGAATSYFQSH